MLKLYTKRYIPKLYTFLLKLIPQVFQLVAGLLTSDLVQKLDPVLEEFLLLLQLNTGISVKPQDSEGSGYLLEGSWTQLHKSRILLEIAQTADSQDIDVNVIFEQAQKVIVVCSILYYKLVN
jgi:hypothetical protein